MFQQGFVVVSGLIGTSIVTESILKNQQLMKQSAVTKPPPVSLIPKPVLKDVKIVGNNKNTTSTTTMKSTTATSNKNKNGNTQQPQQPT